MTRRNTSKGVNEQLPDVSLNNKIPFSKFAKNEL